ncbi:chaplin [Streptomyces sp. TP-A0874]|uniref:chaplin n=1 Tax=Streptomyces sp. TP-A0874 TaxID=549819 RepID=UPI000853A87D|nr:chaplin [Streptomyces sp. TP-A0874]
MRYVARKSLITVVAAGGVLAAVSGYAHADSSAEGAAERSPGVLSGNTVQIPVHVPLNVCGNTVDVIGVLNPAAGSKCANVSESGEPGKAHEQDARSSDAGASARGHSSHSPGVASGNEVQVPVDLPMNVCGNSIDVIGIANPAAGTDCVNEAPAKPHHPGNPEKPEQPGKPEAPEPSDETPAGPKTQVVTEPRATQELAQTGAADGLGIALPIGAGMVLAGTVLYRRARAAA